MNPVSIRPFQYGIYDIEAIEKLDCESFGHGSYKRHSIRQMVDLFSELTFIAESGSEPVGYILGGVDAKSPRSSWLLSIAVSPKKRGGGIAQLLLNSLIQALRERGDTDTILLTVDPENSKAKPLFEDWGWRVESRVSEYFEDEDQRILMRREI